MQYWIYMREKYYGHGQMFFANKATLLEAKEAISEEFKRVPSFEYAEIYDRISGETIFRTRHDSEYRKAVD